MIILWALVYNIRIACYIKPKITMDDEAFYGSYIQSQKCGKVGTKATLDETYIMYGIYYIIL